MPSGRWSSDPSVRRPSVITGSCSSRITVSGISPCDTAAARERWSTSASPYAVEPGRSRRYAPGIGMRVAAPPQAEAMRSIISVTIVAPSVQRRCGTSLGHRACSPARSGATSPATDVSPSPSRQTTMVSFGPGCSWIVPPGVEPEHRDEEVLLLDEHARLDAGASVVRQRRPFGSREGSDLDGHDRTPDVTRRPRAAERTSSGAPRDPRPCRGAFPSPPRPRAGG